jgi:hypothetical protein
MNDTSERAAGSRAEVPQVAALSRTTDDGHGIDPVLAVQLSDRPRYEVWSGEMRLALAVVEDAIATVRLTTGVHTPRAHRLAADAAAWITSRDMSHPFAFENLCDYLGLNAAWLRSGLRLTMASRTPTRRPANRRVRPLRIAASG